MTQPQQTSLERNAASQYAILVTMKWGDSPTIVRYCRYNHSIQLGLFTYLAVSELDVTLGENHGGTKAVKSSIILPTKYPPCTRKVTGYPHAEIEITIEQIDPTNISTRRLLFFGWVGETTENPNGKKGMTKFDLDSIKAKIAELQLSVPALSTCINLFGGPYCQAAAQSWERTGTVTTISNTTITIDFGGAVSDPVAELPNERFRRGDIYLDGLSLLIKRSLQDGSFELFEPVPPWWLGQSVKVSPGCDGRLDSCRIWGREESFNGLAILTVGRNPVFGEPQR